MSFLKGDIADWLAGKTDILIKSFPPIIDDGLNDTMLTCLVVELYSPILSTTTRPLAALTTCSFLEDFATPAVTCVSLIIRQVTPSTSKLLLRTT